MIRSRGAGMPWFRTTMLLNAAKFSVFVAASLSAAAAAERPGLGTVRMLDLGIAISSAIQLVAQHGGFFKAEGLDATRTSVGSGSTAVSALLRDDGDVLFTASATIAVAYAKGAKELVIIGAYNKGFSTQLIVRKSWLAPRGVDRSSSLAARVKALSGIRMGGVGAGSAQDRFARHILNQGGLSAGRDVALLAFGGPDLSFAAFQEGRMDGLIASDPWAAQAVAGGDAIVYVTGEDYPIFQGFPALVYAVKRSALASRPEFFAAFCRAMVNAGRFTIERTPQARAIVQAQFPNIAANVFESSWSGTLDKTTGAVHLAAQGPAVSPTELKKVLDFSSLTDVNPAALLDNSCVSVSRR